MVQPLTIVHGGKAIPHVPGIPGPNSLLDPSLVRKPPEQQLSPVIINQTESAQPLLIPNEEIPKTASEPSIFNVAFSPQSKSVSAQFE